MKDVQDKIAIILDDPSFQLTLRAQAELQLLGLIKGDK